MATITSMVRAIQSNSLDPVCYIYDVSNGQNINYSYINMDKLQERETELWKLLEIEVGSSTIDLIAELVEVNLELEALSNK